MLQLFIHRLYSSFKNKLATVLGSIFANLLSFITSSYWSGCLR